MRINKKWVVQDQSTGLWLSAAGALVEDKIMAGRFTRPQAQKLAMAKFGATYEQHVWIVELDIREFRLMNLAKARRNVTRKKKRHLRYAGNKRHAPAATENLITLLARIKAGNLDGIEQIGEQVRRDYLPSIKIWENFHRQKMEILKGLEQ